MWKMFFNKKIIKSHADLEQLVSLMRDQKVTQIQIEGITITKNYHEFKEPKEQIINPNANEGSKENDFLDPFGLGNDFKRNY